MLARSPERTARTLYGQFSNQESLRLYALYLSLSLSLSLTLSLSLYNVYIHIYIYIERERYIYRERERGERGRPRGPRGPFSYASSKHNIFILRIVIRSFFLLRIVTLPFYTAIFHTKNCPRILISDFTCPFS